MSAYRDPRPRRPPRAGALAIALGAGLAVFATLGQATTDDTTAPTNTKRDGTAASVLRAVIDRSTSLPPSDPAVPATFLVLPGTSVLTTTRVPSGTTAPPPTLGPAVSVTSPDPPRTSTTRPHPSTTTTSTTDTTEAPTTTTSTDTTLP